MQSGLLSVTSYHRVLSSWPLDQSPVESEMTPPPVRCTQWWCSWGSTRFVPTVLCVVHLWRCLLRGLVILFFGAESVEVKKSVSQMVVSGQLHPPSDLLMKKLAGTHRTRDWVKGSETMDLVTKLGYLDSAGNGIPIASLFTLYYSNSSAVDEGFKANGELEIMAFFEVV